MHIKKVEINGFAMFNKTIIELENKENIIVGTNGVGKTIFLQLLNHVFDNIDEYLPQQINLKTHCDNYINIHIVLNDNDKKYITNIYVLFFILNYKSFFSNNYFGENIQKINDELKKINDILYYNIIINYKEIDKPSINLNLCDNVCTYNGHKYSNIKDCKYAQIVDNIKNCVQLNNLNSNLYIHNENIDKIRIFLQEENFLNFDVLFLLNNFLANIENINNMKIDMKNIFDLNLNNLNFEKFIKYFIKSKITYVPIVNDISIYNINKYISEYFEKHKKYILNESNPILSKKYSAIIYGDLINFLSPLYEVKQQLFYLKNDNPHKYINIQNKFKNIINKNFDINKINDDYLICILNDDCKYNCSQGEYELILFLTKYYVNDNNIILIDEPFIHLSSQNKISLKKFINDESKINKQLIIITHDVELISIQQNIIYFYVKNNISHHENIKYIVNKLGKESIKILEENLILLFAKKILFVEGYFDYKFYSSILKYNNNDEYIVIIMNGCGSQIWKIADLLQINYKIIYDTDKIYDKNNKGKCVKFIFENLKDTELYKEINSEINQYSIKFEDVEKSINHIKIIHEDIIMDTIEKYKNHHFEKNFGNIHIERNKLKYEPQNNVNIKNKFGEDEYKLLKFKDIHEDIRTKYYDLYKNKFPDDDFFNSKQKEFNNPFIDMLNICVYNKYNKLDISKIIKEINGTNKYFVLEENIKDLEGYGRIFFGNSFCKKQWHFYTIADICNNISKKIDNQYIKNIIEFLK